MRNPMKSWIGSVTDASFRALLHTALMTSLLQWSAAQLSVSPDVVTAAVGDTVTLSVGYSGRLLYFTWYRGAGTHADDSILGVVGNGPPNHGPGYTGRETALQGVSLRIRDVQVNYTGSYTVQVYTDPGRLQDATVQLRVYVPVTKPTVTSNNSHPVEYNDTVTMTCNTSGAAEKIFWFFNSQNLLIDNTMVYLSQDNRTLKFSNVSRLVSGTYQCKAINPISSDMSDPQTLTVSYGPEDTKIDPSGAKTLQAGETLTLSCNTRSVPEIDTYEWFRNNISLQFNKKLSVSRVSSKDEGIYTCLAHNSATSKSANASVFIAVKVPAPVTKPTVTITSSYPVEYNDTVTMTCNSSGAAETILWFFKNQDLLIDNTRIELSAKNQTLRISNVSRLDSGTYQCKAINTISANISDPQTLAVSYGPEGTWINPSGAQTLLAGGNFTLSCYTWSVPEIDTYEWFFNNTNLQLKKNLSVSRVSSKDEGIYTCLAHNSATGKSDKASVFIAVKEDPGNLASLPIYAIVGIVIAGLLAVILVVVLVYYCRTKSSKVQSTAEAISRGTTHGNNGAQTNTNSRGSPEEMHYTTVRFEPKTEKARAPPPLENTIYSQVKAANHHDLPPAPPSAGTIIYSEARLTCEGKSVRPPPTENTIYSQVKTAHHK